MKIDILFNGILIRNFAATREWYGTLLGRREDVIATESEVMWRCTEAARVCVWMTAAARERRWWTCALSVGTPRSRSCRPWESGVVQFVGESGHRAVVTDPDGNSLDLAEAAP